MRCTRPHRGRRHGDKVESSIRAARCSAIKRRWPAASRRPAGAPPPAPGEAFDALLLPEGGAQLKQMARQLGSRVDSAKVRLLGSGLWDDPSIGSEPALYGGWFAASPPEARREFESRFQTTYGQAPPRLASLAFDARRSPRLLAKAAGREPFSQRGDPQPGRLYRRRRAVPFHAGRLGAARPRGASKSARPATPWSARPQEFPGFGVLNLVGTSGGKAQRVHAIAHPASRRRCD